MLHTLSSRLSPFFCLLFCCSILMLACHGDADIGTEAKDQFWLQHDDAKMLVRVEGNTASKTFLLILHGGPGGDAQIYNLIARDFTEPLENDMALVYWDQRGSGSSKGNYDKKDLTIAQFTEDLEQLVDLLYFRYGSDINLFLLGHSWGGLLGSAFLVKDQNQEKIKGWIEVDGAHNFELLVDVQLTRIAEVANDQIIQGNSASAWEEILDDLQELNPNALSNDDKVTLNVIAGRGEAILRADNVVNNVAATTDELANYLLFSYHNSISSFFNGISTSTAMTDELVNANYSASLSKVSIPALFLWGFYDLRVPRELAFDAFNNIGTPDQDKLVIIFNRSEHSPMINEPASFSSQVQQFIDTYK